VLLGILKVFRDMRRGAYDEAALEEQLNNRGLMNRILGGATKAIRKPWHMYPLGLLFGLGFDTATEVGLLVLAGGAAAFNLPWYAILVLPVLFAAGMSLLDSIDGCFMNFAYGWAFSKPVRKVYYNITITGLSVAVALIIGTIELVSSHRQARHQVWPVCRHRQRRSQLRRVRIVGLFVVTWVGALAVWRFGRIEQRWSATYEPRRGPTERSATQSSSGSSPIAGSMHTSPPSTSTRWEPVRPGGTDLKECTWAARTRVVARSANPRRTRRSRACRAPARSRRAPTRRNRRRSRSSRCARW
jgi:high-affinity nickel-transport protein